MPNRLRMVTASFLCKTLLVNWQEGEKYFAEKLLDFDLSANSGGWQWSSSSGCDSQPYFRIFNPVSQSKSLIQKGNLLKPGALNFNHYQKKRSMNPIYLAHCFLPAKGLSTRCQLLTINKKDKTR